MRIALLLVVLNLQHTLVLDYLPPSSLDFKTFQTLPESMLKLSKFKGLKSRQVRGRNFVDWKFVVFEWTLG
jgi:hypothetical protein